MMCVSRLCYASWLGHTQCNILVCARIRIPWTYHRTGFNYGVLRSALFRPIAYLVIVFGGNWGGLLIEWFSTRHATAQRAREDGKSTHCARYVLPRECCSWLSYLQTSMDPFGGWKTICTCRYRIRQCQESKGSCSSNMWHCSWPSTESLFTGFKYQWRLITAG